MIEVLCGDAEREVPGQLHDRSSMVGRLAKAGIQSKAVTKPSSGVVTLCFARRDSAIIEEMSPANRNLAVLVDEGSRLEGSKAEEARRALGLLGLVEASAWSKWKRGVLVAWGLFGRDDVAGRAGLTALGSNGLQPAKDREELSDALARFLKAAAVER